MAPLDFSAIRGFRVGVSALDRLPSCAAAVSGHSAAYSLNVGNPVLNSDALHAASRHFVRRLAPR